MPLAMTSSCALMTSHTSVVQVVVGKLFSATFNGLEVGTGGLKSALHQIKFDARIIDLQMSAQYVFEITTHRHVCPFTDHSCNSIKMGCLHEIKGSRTANEIGTKMEFSAVGFIKGRHSLEKKKLVRRTPCIKGET